MRVRLTKLGKTRWSDLDLKGETEAEKAPSSCFAIAKPVSWQTGARLDATFACWPHCDDSRYFWSLVNVRFIIYIEYERRNACRVTVRLK